MNNNKLEALSQALKREEEGRAYYQKALMNTTNELGKRMFEFLVRAEESHIQKIKQIYDSLENSVKWANIISNPIEKSGKAVCAEIISSFKEDIKGEVDDIQALKIALKMEDESIKFYQCQAEATEDLAEKKFYLLLVNEETDHWLSILESIEYLEDPQGYFHQKEMIRSMFM
ncbi:MAG: ferritin family protein [Desulfobacterota bacterium]|nr:ferritin family protein [Thermodesulfobacteriota bacterium]